MSLIGQMVAHDWEADVPEEWWEDRSNLLQLWRYLEFEGQSPEDPANYLERPWAWSREYGLMLEHFAGMDRAQEREAAA